MLLRFWVILTRFQRRIFERGGTYVILISIIFYYVVTNRDIRPITDEYSRKISKNSRNFIKSSVMRETEPKQHENLLLITFKMFRLWRLIQPGQHYSVLKDVFLVGRRVIRRSHPWASIVIIFISILYNLRLRIFNKRI